MKIASLIAKVGPKWTALAQGEDVDGIRSRYKEIKGAGVLVVGKASASDLRYFDSSGDLRRCKLKSPSEIKAIATANNAEATRAAKAAQAEAEKAAEAEGKKKATQVAEKALEVITSELVSGAAVKSKPEGAQSPELEKEPAATPTQPEPVADAEADDGDEDEVPDAASRFGGEPKV